MNLLIKLLSCLIDTFNEQSKMENIEKIDISEIPENIPLKEMIEETHMAFYIPKEKKSGDK